MKLFAIETKKYSYLVLGFINEYPGCQVKIDGKLCNEPATTWCTNGKLKQYIDFKLIVNGEAVLGFHDSPSEFWALPSEEELLSKLAKENSVRYQALAVK